MKSNIHKWVGVQIESSGSLTKQFAQFSRDYKKAIAEVAEDFEIVAYSRGHFDVSGFLKHKETEKLVYFSSSDIRHSSRWLDQVLIRTAEHIKDYKGGSNHYTELDNLNNKASQLVQ